MAITLGVGPTLGSGFPATTAVITLVGTTAGRGIVILIVWQDDGGARTISSITVSGESNAVVSAGSKADLDTTIDHTQCAFLNNITTGGDKTITVTFSGSAYSQAVAVEVIGLDTTAGVDAALSASGTLSSPVTGNIVTATANAAIFSVTTVNGAIAPTAGANFTLLSNPRADNSYKDEDEYWLDSGAAGSKAVAYTTADSGSWILSAISIKVASGGMAYDAATFQAMLMQTQGGAAMIGRACRGVYG